MSSTSFRHLLSPILRRWCTSSSSSSTTSCANNSERYELNSSRRHRDKVTKCDVTHNDVGSDSDDSATTKTKENEFTDIQVAKSPDMRSESRALISGGSKRPCGKTKAHFQTTATTSTAATTMSPKIPLTKQMSSNSKMRGVAPSASSTVAKQFSRGNSTQETLSKDEARRRMLSWRKTTKLRKSSGNDVTTTATATQPVSTGNGSSKRAKESTRVRRITSAAVADTTTTTTATVVEN